MTAWIKLNRIVHFLALLIWASAMISAAVAAINVFGTLSPEKLPLVMEHYPAVPAEEHPRLAASHIMADVFFTVDLLQFAAAPLALLTFAIELLLFKARLRRPANLVRLLTLIAAATLLAYHATGLAPLMNQQLRDRWQALERGDLQTAAALRASFNAYHERADLVLRLNLVLVLTAVGAAAAASVERKDGVRNPGEDDALPAPQLARR